MFCFRTIADPVGRVYFAGTETATEWSSYMDGMKRCMPLMIDGVNLAGTAAGPGESKRAKLNSSNANQLFTDPATGSHNISAGSSTSIGAGYNVSSVSSYM